MKLINKQRKERAVYLRKSGLSICKIQFLTKISKSTLSGWFKNIKLTEKQKGRLLLNKTKALILAREKARVIHKKNKILRNEHLKKEVLNTLRSIKISDKSIAEIALSMLYLGEGFKKNGATGIGNSDPVILKMFISCIKKIYNIDIKDVRCQLLLRADQSEQKEKIFWSEELGLPTSAFTGTQFDKRTIGKETRPDYHGVCIVRCPGVAIQRKLVYLGRAYCNAMIKKGD